MTGPSKGKQEVMLASLTGLGLSAAAGLNAYIPLLLVGLLARFTDVITLPEPYRWIQSGWALAVVSVLLLAELVLDKVAVVDHVNDVVQTLVRLEQRRQAAKVTPAPAPAPPSGGGGGGSVSASGKACILDRPYSYVDSWGAARSGGRSHQGTDVMAPYGARVYAFVNGVVSRESSSTNGGIQLYLQGDNGVEYFYAHLSGYAVSAGTRVRAGQLVAYNGQTGNARYTAPHVHFEVHIGGSPVNPYPHLKPVCG